MAEFILGISAFYHDSAAVLLRDHNIVAAVQEERFSRKKHDPSFPSKAIEYVLKEGNIELSDLSCIAFYDKPWLKFERLLETYHAFAPVGLKSFLKSMPLWIGDKLFFRSMLRKELKKIGAYRCPLLFPEHHLSHASSAFYASPYRTSAILTVDGVGEWATSMIGRGVDHKITVLRELRFPHSVGLLYSAFTYYLGFRVNSGEYKLMGLAPYGDVRTTMYKSYRKVIEDELVDIRDDGSIVLNMDYFNYTTGLTMTKDRHWEQLLGLERRHAESSIRPQHTHLALAIQHVTEDIVTKMARTAKGSTNADNLVMAGGVALNCVANNTIRKTGMFKEIWVQPASGDAGGALGAALATRHIYFGKERVISDKGFPIALGPNFGEGNIKSTLDYFNAKYQNFEDKKDLVDKTAKLINEGYIVGWFQGRMEYGPRALGYRSILADARNTKMQKRLNLKIKFREGFRPFAPVVLEEEASKYFCHGLPSPYMLFVDELKDEWRNEYPEESLEWGWERKLYFERSQLPAITHIDYTARIQTVNAEDNPLFHKLILRFKQLTDVGILINTSFNVRGEPIVCSPKDAYQCFLKTEMDYLVIGNFLCDRREQSAELIDEFRRSGLSRN